MASELACRPAPVKHPARYSRRGSGEGGRH